MPKGRMLNKKICCSEKVAKLSLPATLLFTWGIPHQDCEGRIYGNPEQIKGIIAPHIKEITLRNIPKLLNEMVEADLIILYGDNDYKYIQYKGFEGEQKVNKDREAPSEIPAPTQEQLRSNSGVTPAKVKLSKVKLSKDASKEAQSGKEKISLVGEKIFKPMREPPKDWNIPFQVWRYYHPEEGDSVFPFVQKLIQAVRGKGFELDDAEKKVARFIKEICEDPKVEDHKAVLIERCKAPGVYLDD